MNPTDETPATTVLLKIEDVDPKALDAVYDAIDEHVVERGGGSYFTLVEDGKRLRVDEGSPHLVSERLEASLYAHARSLLALCIEHGLPVPRQLARDYADFCAFFDKELDEDELEEAEDESEDEDEDDLDEDDESDLDEDDVEEDEDDVEEDEDEDGEE